MPSISTIVKKSAAGIAAVGISAGIMAASAGIASASSYPEYVTKNHAVTATVVYDVHQNNFFHKADKHSVRTGPSGLGKGMPNTETHYQGYLESAPADDTFGVDRFYLTEVDTAGTLKVNVVQTLAFHHATAVSNNLAVTIAPNATRSFWLDTVGAGGDYVHSLVTVTNKVS